MTRGGQKENGATPNGTYLSILEGDDFITFYEERSLRWKKGEENTYKCLGRLP